VRYQKEGVITHIAVVHTETTSGILNPPGEVATVVEKHGRGLLISAMSSFGTIEINVCDMRFDAVYTSSNKCLEGARGHMRGALVAVRHS